LSAKLNCSKSDCEVLSGSTSPRKRILIKDGSLDAIREALHQ
jgi:uncharacterized protein YggU (UPF0235/DUF167 family)